MGYVAWMTILEASDELRRREVALSPPIVIWTFSNLPWKSMDLQWESPLVLPPPPVFSSQVTSQPSLCPFVHEGYLNLKNAQLDLIQELTQPYGASLAYTLLPLELPLCLYEKGGWPVCMTELILFEVC